MPPVRVSVEFSDAHAAELAVWCDFFKLPQEELVAEAALDGFMLRRARYEYEREPAAKRGSDLHFKEDLDPELVAEAAAFVELLDGMMDRTLDGTGQTVRFNLMVPVEVATLAAWLSLKWGMRLRREHGPLYRAVCLKREGDGYRMADYYRAKAYLTDAMQRQMSQEFGRLCDGTHSLLRPLPPPSPRSDVIDDDIPF